MPSLGGFSWPRDRAYIYYVSCLAGRFFTTNAIWEAQIAALAQTVKNPPAIQKTQVPSQGQEDPMEKGIATHSSSLALRIPWTEKPGKL